MENIKCITFDKEAQDNLPQEIKDRMKVDRERAELEQHKLMQEIEDEKEHGELLSEIRKKIGTWGCGQITLEQSRQVAAILNINQPSGAN